MTSTAIALLLALSLWAFPQPVASQTQAKLETTSQPNTVKIKTQVTEIELTKAPSNESATTSNPAPIKPTTHIPRSTTPKTSAKTGYGGKAYSKEEVQQLIRDYSAQYGISADVPLCVAKLESGYNQFSKNKNSSASGVFQYLSGTWKATDEGKAGLSVFDADANVRAAIKYMASRKSTKPWVVGTKCPSLK